MSHAALTPVTDSTPWWRRLLSLEPVAVQAVVRAVFVLAGTLGLTIPDEVSGKALAAVAAFYALVEVATTLWARSRVTPQDKVVQSVEPNGEILAGPASPVTTGTVVGYAATADPATAD